VNAKWENCRVSRYAWAARRHSNIEAGVVRSSSVEAQDLRTCIEWCSADGSRVRVRKWGGAVNRKNGCHGRCKTRETGVLSSQRTPRLGLT